VGDPRFEPWPFILCIYKIVIVPVSITITILYMHKMKLMCIRSCLHSMAISHLYTVRSGTLARDMAKMAFISVVQISTLKLAFVVEYRPHKF
jgi:hypothetical protein